MVQQSKFFLYKKLYILHHTNPIDQQIKQLIDYCLKEILCKGNYTLLSYSKPT